MKLSRREFLKRLGAFSLIGSAWGGSQSKTQAKSGLSGLPITDAHEHVSYQGRTLDVFDDLIERYPDFIARIKEAGLWDWFQRERQQAQPLAEAFSIWDTAGVSGCILLAGGFEREKPNFKYEFAELAQYILLDKYPNRFLIASTVDFSMMDEPDFSAKAVAHLEETYKKGCRGLGEIKLHPPYHHMPLDDPRLDPLWETCVRLKIPAHVHVAQPDRYWQPGGPYYRNPDIPSKQSLLDAFERVVKKHPNTTFIAVHMGTNPERLDYLARMLDAYKNYYLDTSAIVWVIEGLGKDPEAGRTFVTKYQDRIVFGGEPRNLRDYMDYRRFFETDETVRGYRRLKLPPEVLQKIYYQNIERLVPEVKHLRDR